MIGLSKRLWPILLVLCFHCAPQHPTKPALYFWQTKYALTATEGESLASLNVERIYLRMFDVAWDDTRQMPMPIGKLQRGDQPWFPNEVVPVVFITEETMFQGRTTQLSDLAQNLVSEVIYMSQGIGTIPELQIDCDWIRRSRDAYFYFLEQVRLHLPPTINLSATIRLHQIRHRKEVGVPPVDRGALMVYHTGTPLEADPGNSILDLDLAKGYLHHLDTYPLPLDAALPIFSWALQYDDTGRFVRIMRHVSRDSIEGNDDFERLKSGDFRVLRNCTLHNKRMMKGDRIEIEHIDRATLNKLARLLAQKLPKQPRHVILFDYQTQGFQEMNNEQSFRHLFSLF